MNEFLILIILKLRPSNIYEIKKIIDRNFAPFMQISVGVIIPILKKFEKLNAVKKEVTMTGGGLKRSVYSVLECGETLINNYLTEEIICAPQLLRREIDILMFIYGAENFPLLENEEKIYCEILTPEQKKLLGIKIKTALENNIKIIQDSVNYNQINPEFLNLELIYSEAKLRLLNNDDEEILNNLN